MVVWAAISDFRRDRPSALFVAFRPDLALFVAFHPDLATPLPYLSLSHPDLATLAREFPRMLA
jgi:hypothetical protein